MMLQQNYFKPLKFTVRGLFFWRHLSTSPKNIFFKEESQFKVERSTHFIRQWNWETCFFVFQLAGDGFNLHSAYLTKQVAAWKIFTLPKNSRTDTKHDVGRGKCIYLLSNYMCHFEYPWGEKPENPSIFRKKHSFANTLAACPTNVT